MCLRLCLRRGGKINWSVFSGVHALAHSAFLEHSKAEFPPCFQWHSLEQGTGTDWWSCASWRLRCDSCIKQHMLLEKQGRKIGLGKCEGTLETVITYPPQGHFGSVAAPVFLRALCQILSAIVWEMPCWMMKIILILKILAEAVLYDYLSLTAVLKWSKIRYWLWLLRCGFSWVTMCDEYQEMFF